MATRISGWSIWLKFVIRQHFSWCCCSYRKQIRDQSKTCLVGLLIRSILRWKNCTRAEALVQLFPRKIERINRPTRHVFLQYSTLEQKCAQIGSNVLYCEIWDRWILGFVRLAYLRVPDLEMSCKHLTTWEGTSIGYPTSHGLRVLVKGINLRHLELSWLSFGAYPEHRVSVQASSPAPQELAGLPHSPHCDMAGCWQINFILAYIGHKNYIRISDQYLFIWNISIWA